MDYPKSLIDADGDVWNNITGDQYECRWRDDNDHPQAMQYDYEYVAKTYGPVTWVPSQVDDRIRDRILALEESGNLNAEQTNMVLDAIGAKRKAVSGEVKLLISCYATFTAESEEAVQIILNNDKHSLQGLLDISGLTIQAEGFSVANAEVDKLTVSEITLVS